MFTIISFFPKINKRWVGLRAGGWKIVQKLITERGDYSVLESTGRGLCADLTYFTDFSHHAEGQFRGLLQFHTARLGFDRVLVGF